MMQVFCLFFVVPCVLADDEGRRRRSAPMPSPMPPAPSPTPPTPSPWGPYPDGVPGSGYGCSRTCGDVGDVHFEIEARLETYAVPGSGAHPDFASDAKMFTRTFVGTKGPFCSMADTSSPYNGSEGALGPCLQVQPGQTMTIKLVNRMENGMSVLHQAADSRRTWWDIAASSTPDGQPDFLDHGESLHWTAPRPATPDDMRTNLTENIPGWEVSFDVTNIHLHGMQVVPHLFYPLGTDRKAARWIGVTPSSEDPASQCFCYVFKVPEDHPMGTYMWHVHRHGAAVMQAWQGMLGVLKVDGDAAGSPTRELASQKVKRDQDFVMWEWAVDARKEIDHGVFAEGNFVFMANGGPSGDPTTLTLVNNEYQPTFALKKGEAMHVRLICAQATTGTAWYLLDESGDLVDFYVFASDGISYRKTYRKRVLVMGPGQREGVLVQFRSKGTYRVMQGIIGDFNENNADIGPGVGSPDEPVAFFHVSGSDLSGDSLVDLSNLKFTPGIHADIDEKQVTQRLAVDFTVGARLDTISMPQFTLDNTPFDVTKSVLSVAAGSVASWHLTSSMNYFHPFHVHVNPFQVQSINATLAPQRLRPYLSLVEPALVWRDTVFIPPYGAVEALQRFGSETGVAWQGKTIFHCHFFDHEDQGMMGAFLISEPAAFDGDALKAEDATVEFV